MQVLSQSHNIFCVILAEKPFAKTGFGMGHEDLRNAITARIFHHCLSNVFPTQNLCLDLQASCKTKVLFYQFPLLWGQIRKSGSFMYEKCETLSMKIVGDTMPSTNEHRC